MTLKEEILNYPKLFRKDGIVNSNFLNTFHKTSLYTKLVNNTNFLSNDCKFTERWFCLHHNITLPNLCKLCNTEVNFEGFTRGYRIYCSRTCKCKDLANPKLMQDPKFREKAKQTKLEKYGSTTYNNREKAKQTNLKRYGVEWGSQSEFIKKKIGSTNLKKYGNVHPYHKGTYEKTCFAKYNKSNANQEHIPIHILQQLNNKEWLIEQHHTLLISILGIGIKLGVSDKTVGSYCKKHNIEIKHHFCSYPEKQLVEYIESKYNTKVITNNRTIIKPLELDIYLPEYHLAIEYNGVYWHRPEIYGSKDKWVSYHQNKINLCNAKGIQLLHLWENYKDHNALLNDAINSIIDNNLEKIFKDIYEPKNILAR